MGACNMLRIQGTRLAIAGLITSAALGANPALDPAGDCQNTHRIDLKECNSEFNNPASPTYQNQTAFETCTRGALAALNACLAGDPNNPHREDFINDLKRCITDWPDGGPAYESCLAAALMVYRSRLGLTPQDPCALAPAGTGRTAPMDTLRSAALAMGDPDGKYPVEANSTLSFQAGVSAAGSYNLAGRPCIKQAELIAIYQTKDGPQAVSLDADPDTSDGVFFDLPIFANRLIDTNELEIIAIYFDDASNPVFMEHATLSILPSPIRGDWNRDQVKDTSDILDFISSFTSQVPRADLNVDGSHNTTDISEFLQDFTD